MRKIKRNEPILKIKKPSEPPHIVALRELDKLKAEKLWQKGKIKEYYTRLTEIVRWYIEQRYNVMALEQTSNEIITSLKYIGVTSDSVIEVLKQLLSLSDLVKFAKAQPLPGENDNNLGKAYSFIEETKLVPQEETDSNEDQILQQSEANTINKQLVAENSTLSNEEDIKDV